jgi:hypothetical protein
MLAGVLATLPPDPQWSQQPSHQMSAAHTPAPMPVISPPPGPAPAFNTTPVPSGYGGANYPPQAPYSPHPPAAYAPPSYAAPAKSRLPMFMILGAVVLGGAGVAVWAATHGGSSKKPDTHASGEEPKHDDDDKGGKPDHDGDSDDKGSATGSATDPWATGSGSTGPDPWAAKVGATPKAPSARSDDADDVGTAATPIPAGAHLDPPAGFKAIPNQQGWQVYGSQKQVLMILAPLYPGTNDPDALAQKWIADNKDMGLVYAGAAETQNHTMLTFSGHFNGEVVVQYATLYITPKYRLAYILQTPVGEGADFQLVANLLVKGVTLP